jgi:hypothetical protein
MIKNHIRNFETCYPVESVSQCQYYTGEGEGGGLVINCPTTGPTGWGAGRDSTRRTTHSHTLLLVINAAGMSRAAAVAPSPAARGFYNPSLFAPVPAAACEVARWAWPQRWGG